MFGCSVCVCSAADSAAPVFSPGGHSAEPDQADDDGGCGGCCDADGDGCAAAVQLVLICLFTFSKQQALLGFSQHVSGSSAVGGKCLEIDAYRKGPILCEAAGRDTSDGLCSAGLCVGVNNSTLH